MLAVSAAALSSAQAAKEDRVGILSRRAQDRRSCAHAGVVENVPAQVRAERDRAFTAYQNALPPGRKRVPKPQRA